LRSATSRSTFHGFSSLRGAELAVVADMDDLDAPAVIASLHWGPP
jgi:hypothetical protein